MGQQIQCPGCSTKLAIKPELFGKKIKCPKCHQMLQLKSPVRKQTAQSTTLTSKQTQSRNPAASNHPTQSTSHSQTSHSQTTHSQTLQCNCGTKLKVQSKHAGKKVRCPKCQQPVTVPLAKAAAGPASIATPPDSSFDPQPATAGDIDLGGIDFGAVNPPASTQASSGESLWDDLPTTPAAPVRAFTPSSMPIEPSASNANTPSPMGGTLAAEQMANAQVALENDRNRQYDDDEPKSWLATRLYGLAFVVMLGGPVMAYSGCRDQMRSSALAKDGITVPGIIMSGIERRGRRFRRSYTLTVAYVTEDGKAELRDFSVTGSFFAEHARNSAITNESCQIQYSQSDPSVVQIMGANSGGPVRIVTGIAMLFAGIGGIVLLRWIDLD